MIMLQCWEIINLPLFEKLDILSITPEVVVFFLRFYLFIHERHRERERERGRERQRHREREKQVPCREPDVGLHSASPASHPGQKGGLKR